MKQDRNTKLVSGFLANGFDFKNTHYNPITARTLILLEKCKSPYYFGGDQLKGLLDVLYISSHDSKSILSSINNEEWEELIIDFADQFTPSDLEALGNLINTANEDASAAVVEIKDSEVTKKK